MLQRPQGRQQPRVGEGGGRVDLQDAHERRLKGSDQVRHRAWIVTDRQPEESLGAGFVVGILGPCQQRGPNVGAVDVGERPETERGPVPDLRVDVARG